LKWNTAVVESKGNHTKTNVTDMAKICQQAKVQEQGKLRFLMNKVSYENAKLICKKMGGQMPLPTSKKDFNATIGKNYYSDSTINQVCKKLWLPIIQVKISY
jgi:hypothetical protein